MEKAAATFFNSIFFTSCLLSPSLPFLFFGPINLLLLSQPLAAVGRRKPRGLSHYMVRFQKMRVLIICGVPPSDVSASISVAFPSVYDSYGVDICAAY